MIRRSEGAFIPCTLALGLTACAAPERDNDPFGGELDGSGPGATSAADAGEAGTDAADSVTPADSATGSADEEGDDPKFDLGNGADIMGNPDGMQGDGCLHLDMVFVVDISGSMSEEKANLNANFPEFVQVLDDYVGNNAAVGYRIGVTNSSHQADGSTTGLDGELVNRGGFGGTDDCGTGGQHWLEGPDPGLSTNFPCLADFPTACTNSCSDLGVERPLDTIMGFIDKSAPGGVNDGFYRGEESLLVIVTLTDEDDQSTATPAETKAALDAFTGGEERYVVVTVAGRQNAGCTSAFGDATSAPRLHDFTTSVPNGLMGDICEGDLTQSLEEALGLITDSCDNLPPPEG